MTRGPFSESAIEDEAEARAQLEHEPVIVPHRLGQWSWAIFEWGTTPYVLLITIYIFAPYFSSTVVGDPVQGQAIWGYINGIAGAAIGLLAPIMGAVADQGGKRKPWIAGFLALIIPCVAALWFALPEGQGLSILAITILITLITVSYEFSIAVHNAMLPTIVEPKKMGSLSGLGLSLGNAGGLFILITMLWAFALPGQVDWGFLPDAPLLGLDAQAHEPSRIAGPIVALWMLIFTLPLFFFTPDIAPQGQPPLKAVREGFRSIGRTIRRLTAHYRNIAVYLLARMLFNDGKTAILIFGGVYASGIFGWGLLELLVYGISLSMFAIFGGLIGGWLDDWVGSKVATLIAIGGTSVGLACAATITPEAILFMALDNPDRAIWQGPVFRTLPELAYMGFGFLLAIFVTAAYATSRVMLARLAPMNKMSEFFGLYALSGKATAFVGPLIVGIFTGLSGSQRIGFASILILLAAGFIVLLFVREERSPEAPPE